jgi:thioredoxin-like negative regulator of GroEL
LKANDPTGALEAQEAIKTDPQNVEAVLALASVQLSRGDADRALQRLDAGAGYQKDDPRSALKVAF